MPVPPLPARVSIVDVAPRDGLQSYREWVPTESKIALVDHLTRAGIGSIEVTSFARPEIVPNLRDAEEVLAGITRSPGVTYRALVPNLRGAERALNCGTPPDVLVALTVASDTYLAKNQNMSSREATSQILEIARLTRSAEGPLYVVIGGAFWDPYEGRTPQRKVLDLVAEFEGAGITHVTLAGSLGMEDPQHVWTLFGSIASRWPSLELSYHVHNLAGLASANVLAAMQAGVSAFETSICGVGGGIAMPVGMAPAGNMATEDLVYMLNEMGIGTGLDTDEIIDASRAITSMLGILAHSFISRVGSRASWLASNHTN